MPVALRAILIGSVLLALASCRMVEPHSKAKSPLVPISVSPDAITLEVFSAPVPRGEEQLVELWKLVDEQPLPPELRRSLNDNGFRVGLIGPNVPTVLAEVLKVTEKSAALEDQHLMSLNPEGTVNLRVLHAKSGKRVELAIPNVRDQLQLLEVLDGQVGGKTYHKAECRLGLRAYAETDGKVRIELIPELHHGEFQSHHRGNDGVFMITQERPRRVFEELKMEPRLEPGQMLVLAARPDRTASVGYHFFTDTSNDKALPMLWVVRVAQGSSDAAFHEASVEDDLSAVSNDIEE